MARRAKAARPGAGGGVAGGGRAGARDRRGDTLAGRLCAAASEVDLREAGRVRAGGPGAAGAGAGRPASGLRAWRAPAPSSYLSPLCRPSDPIQHAKLVPYGTSFLSVIRWLWCNHLNACRERTWRLESCAPRLELGAENRVASGVRTAQTRPHSSRVADAMGRACHLDEDE